MLMKKKSLILQLFIILFVILLSLIFFLGYSIYKYSESVIMKDVIKLNSNILQQIAIRIDQELIDVENLASRVAYDKNIIESLENGATSEDAKKQQIQTIESIMAGYIWSYRSTAMLIDAHLIDNSNSIYSTSYSMASKQEADFALYSNIMENKVDIKNLPMKISYKTIGGDDYYFQVVKNVQTYISESNYGVLLLNVNEKLLRDNYMRLIDDEKDFLIVNDNGVVISSIDQSKINNKLTDFVEANNENGLKNYYIKHGMLNIYHPISDSRWYILESISIDSAMAPLKSIEMFMIILGFISLLITGISLRIISKKIAAPLTSLTNKMTEFNNGDILVQIADSPYKEFSEISVSFNELIHRVNYLLEENINKEHQKRLIELDFLQAQINPHFIYNTLSSIRFYVEMGKNSEAEEMLYHFSKLLRRVLSRSDEFVNLKEEILHLKDYIALQKMRYPNIFTVEYILDEKTLDSQIPSFILQPIIENAIFYGLQENTQILIKIESKIVDEDLFIIISDNGIGISEEKISEIFNKEIKTNSVGILNVNERIRILYGDNYGLSIEKNEPKGSKIILKFKYYS